MTKVCSECNKEITRQEEGLSLKLISPFGDKFLCLNCMAKYFNVSVDVLEEKIKQYKKSGCPLF